MDLQIKYPKGEFYSYLVKPESTKSYPGLILIHEIWGLNDHIKDVANRFSDKGYIVLAPDLLGDTGVTEKIDQELLAQMKDPKTRDEAQKKMREATAPIHSPEFGVDAVEKLKSCFNYLKDEAGTNGNIGVLGFCFGGTYSFALAGAQKDLKAAVPFYGHSPEEEDIKNINCPILAFYGDKDEALMTDLPRTKDQMEKYGINFKSIVYPDVGHAFFNNTNPSTYNEQAAKDAWEKANEFLAKFLNE